jgi:cyclopropane-fatty-acyl-phospholipid synthase
MTTTHPRIRGSAVAAPPHSPVRARIAEGLFRRAVRPLRLRVLLPDGTELGGGSPGDPVLRLVRPAAFFLRLGTDAMIGFGEAYLAGDWTVDTTEDLPDVLTAFAERLPLLVPPWLHGLRRLVHRPVPDHEENTLHGARRNIHRHYDLSNELFAAFLDPGMTYSSAWFDGDPTLTLEAAQDRKIDGVLDFAGVRAGTHVVEIGTGWGTLAIRAAQRGARVTSLTISAEQQALAERRIADAGVADRVQVLLRDYREANGSYDAVVSVEMVEAVGERYWPTYFATLDRLLRPGGRVGLQSITMAHDRMLATRGSHGWINEYVFPGGLIPSVTAIEEAVADHTSLRIDHRRDFGRDYARTLRLWRERFLAAGEHVASLGFDGDFLRMWEFYLAYCEAGFRSGYLGVCQLRLVKEHA